MVDAALTLVVPAFNEERRLDQQAFETFLADEDVLIVFVDDGSSDGTRDVFESIRTAAPRRVVVLGDGINRGKAEAVRLGVAAALDGGSPFVGYWDADLSTPLSSVAEMRDTLEAMPRLDLVMGSRVRLLGRHVERQVWRHYSGRVFATAASVALGLAVYDTQCGAKVWRAGEALNHCFGEPFRSNWAFDVEVLARYILWSFNEGRIADDGIFELPLREWVFAPGSKLTVFGVARAFLDVAMIGRRLRSELSTRR